MKIPAVVAAAVTLAGTIHALDFHDARLHVQFETHMVTEENLPQFIADVKASKAEAVQIALCSVAERGAERAEKFAWCGKLLKTFGDLGYPTAVWTTTLGYGGRQTPAEQAWLAGGQRLVALDGVSHCTASCPLDPQLHDLAAQNLRDFITAGAKVILYDDEWIQTARHHICCLCPRHMALIAKHLGRSVTCDEVRDSFTGGPNPVRTAFLAANGEASMSLARHLRAVADSLDKSVRMGVCATYTLYDFEGLDVEEFLGVLAGEGHRKLLRVSGATYWRRQYDQRYPGEDLDGILELVRMQSAWMRGKDVTVLDENDPYPRKVALVPAWATELYDKAVIADGGLVRNKYILRYDAQRSEPGYLNAHLKNLADDVVLQEIFAGTESYGIRCVFPQHTLRTAELPAEFIGEEELLTLSSHPLAAHFLALNGMPVKHAGSGPVIAFGHYAAYLDEAMMKSGAILDQPGARLLEERGIDTGFTAHGARRAGFYTHDDGKGHRFAVLPFEGRSLNFYGYRPGGHRAQLLKALVFLGADDLCRLEAWRTYQVFARDPRDGSISVLVENLFEEALPFKIATKGRPTVLKALRGDFEAVDDGLLLKGKMPSHGYVAVKFTCGKVNADR